jgi:hypothetical protein
MCAQVGTFVTSSEVPAATTTAYDAATAFVVGFADWGPSGAPVLVRTLPDMAATIGSPAGSGNPYSSRTSTSAVSFDALETYFGEGGYRAYFTRVVGPNPTYSSLALQDVSASTSITVTAAYQGAGGNAIYVAVNNAGLSYSLTLQDFSGNPLAISPSFASNAAGVTWLGTTGLATGVAGPGGLPRTLSATPLSGGTDDNSNATLTNWQNALAALPPSLGPGQVFAPGQTVSTLNGIWNALGAHAQTNNRVALCDMDDNTLVTALVAQVTTIATSGIASYCGFWAGNLTIPGAVPNTTRSVSPSAAIAGMCANADNRGTGNINQAVAGVNYPLQFAYQNTSTISGAGGAIYNSSDLFKLNDAGINTFAVRGGQFLNYGFVAVVPSTNDVIYWQLNHGRTRMSIIADAQGVGEPFVFSQVDGQGADSQAFASALVAMLTGYYRRGALYGATPTAAFSVDVGSDINTATSLEGGQLNAALTVSYSPFAQSVTINLNAVPLTVAAANIAA